MGFWPLVFVLFALAFFITATFLASAWFASEKTDPQRRVTAFAVLGSAILGVFCALLATRPGLGIDQQGLARAIAGQISSAEPKIKTPTGANVTPSDPRRGPDAPATGLPPAPLDVQVTKMPPFDNAALAKAIAEQLPSNTSSPFIDSRTITGFSLAALISSLVLLIVRGRAVEKLWYKDRAFVAAVVAALVALGQLIAPYVVPPPIDPAEVHVTFDKGASLAGQFFFEASRKKPIRFTSADDTPPRNAVCEAMQDLNTGGATVAIVVGSHDQLRLNKNAVLRFSSNSGLARRRAEAVRRILLGESDDPCPSARIPTVITLSNAPLNVGIDKMSPSDLEKDRTVKVFGLAAR